MHGRAETFGEDLQRVICARVSKGPESKHEGASGETEVGAERDGSRHVETVADARVKDHRDRLVESRHNWWERLDRRDRRIELATAVVRHPDGIGSMVDASLGVVRIEDALDDEWPAPFLAKCLEVVPRQGSPEFGADKARRGFHRCRVEVLFETNKTR